MTIHAYSVCYKNTVLKPNSHFTSTWALLRMFLKHTVPIPLEKGKERLKLSTCTRYSMIGNWAMQHLTEAACKAYYKMQTL